MPTIQYICNGESSLGRFLQSIQPKMRLKHHLQRDVAYTKHIKQKVFHLIQLFFPWSYSTHPHGIWKATNLLSLRVLSAASLSYNALVSLPSSSVIPLCPWSQQLVDERPIHQTGHGKWEGLVLAGAQKDKQLHASDSVFISVSLKQLTTFPTAQLYDTNLKHIQNIFLNHVFCMKTFLILCWSHETTKFFQLKYVHLCYFASLEALSVWADFLFEKLTKQNLALLRISQLHRIKSNEYELEWIMRMPWNFLNCI